MKFKELKRTFGVSVFVEIVNIVSMEADCKGYKAALKLSKEQNIPETEYENYIDNTTKITDLIKKEYLENWYLCEEDKHE